MKKIIQWLFFSSAISQTQGQQQNDAATLKQLNAQFIHNYVTSDTAKHSQLLHNNFVYIPATGRYVNRREYLNDWAHGFEGMVYWDYRDERITIYGNTALVRATNKFILLKDGKQITGMALYTDVYVKEAGVWKCVQAQVGHVAPENYPPDNTIVRKYDFRKGVN